ncbi:MAG: hypothetical protein FWD24_01085 [Treponema sp.]|nr:hypothetical protein [Treponema sp.]
MVSYENVPVKNKSEVIHPGHQPVIDTGLLADKTAKLKAGTILKWNIDSTALIAAAPADTPVAVLAEDSDGTNAEVLVCWHGTVIFGRLLNSSGAEPVAATKAMANKLCATGIYPLQLFTSAKKG